MHLTAITEQVVADAAREHHEQIAAGKNPHPIVSYAPVRAELSEQTEQQRRQQCECEPVDDDRQPQTVRSSEQRCGEPLVVRHHVIGRLE